MSARAEQNGLSFGPPLFPDSLKAVVERESPGSVPYNKETVDNPFIGKKILVLSGKEDTLVPWEASKEIVEHLEVGPEGVIRYIVEAGAAHKVTTRMKDEAAKFILDNAIMRRRSRL